jgi:hypothetical protein
MCSSCELIAHPFFTTTDPEDGSVAVKPMSTSFIGVSPEFSIACYTMVALGK